jgi:hypothetical protein
MVFLKKYELLFNSKFCLSNLWIRKWIRIRIETIADHRYFFFLRDSGPTILNFVTYIGGWDIHVVFFSYLIVRFALGILGL